MLSTICWVIAIAALINAARLKRNEIKEAQRMREIAERIALIRARKEKGFTDDYLH